MSTLRIDGTLHPFMLPLTPEQARSVEHDPYKLVRENPEKDQTEVASKYIQHFYACLRKCVKDAAFKRWKTPEAIVKEFRRNVENFDIDLLKDEACTNFEFNFEGEYILEDCDFILANHQGKKEDAQKISDDGKVIGVGGLECLIGIDAFPENARIVLRHDLVDLKAIITSHEFMKELFRSPMKALTRIVKALAFRRNNPITVDRSAEMPEDLKNPSEGNTNKVQGRKRRFERKPRRAHVETMRQERSRVGDAMCDSVKDGVPVVVYPEGTRSPDGKVLGFVSEYFESIVVKYLLPRLYDGRPMKIGLLVADTLRTFPDGVGKKVKAYDHPITMKGVRYDPKNILEALRKTIAQKKRQRDTEGNVILLEEEIQKLGRMMLIEVRALMETTLVDIVNSQ